MPEAVGPGGVKFLHVVNRWQLSAPVINRDPLDPYFGEPVSYEVVAPTRGALQIHPSRVIRFLGNEYPDPTLGLSVWSDSILQDALRRHPRRSPDDDRRHEPDARGQGRRRHGAEPLGAPVERRHDGAALGAHSPMRRR